MGAPTQSYERGPPKSLTLVILESPVSNAAASKSQNQCVLLDLLCAIHFVLTDARTPPSGTPTCGKPKCDFLMNTTLLNPNPYKP